jgi:hypothetical protein
MVVSFLLIYIYNTAGCIKLRYEEQEGVWTVSYFARYMFRFLEQPSSED